jgi:hypothetical protein
MGRPCYQLYADGDSVNGWRFKMRSAKIFTKQGSGGRVHPEV